MTSKKIQTNPCSRRDFVLSSGAIVALCLISCDKPVKKPAQIKPILPDYIRVRIGKQLNKVQIGEHVYSSKSVGDNPKIVEIKPNTKVKVLGKTTMISGVIALHTTNNKEKTIDVVAHVPIEQYLPGVLAGELFAHWHFDTFAAQAIAARSYAATQHFARRRTSHYDVTDGPSSQMFLGNVTLDVAHRAVQETKGAVLTWNNRVVPAYYSACCGGLAATATDAISGAKQHNIPPLCGHRGKDFCTTLDIHKWTVKRSARVLRKRLNACANTLKIPELSTIRTIESIKPSALNQHGRPTKIIVVGRRGETNTIPAREFIRAMNAPIPSLPKITDQAWSSFLAAQKVGASLQINGFGMGHGVVLCQHGAQVLAGRGESWENILSWYYPDASIRL